MIFKKEDKVYNHTHGWGEVRATFGMGNVEVRVKGGNVYLSVDTLSFTEYTLEGFSQVRPKEPLPFKEGYVVYLSDKGAKCWNTSFLRKVGNSHFINDNGVSYSQLALENPLINEETKIYTKDDL